MAEGASEQLGLISRSDIYELEDTEQLMQLRAHLFRVAQYNLDSAYEITDRLIGEGVEPKSRKRRITGLGE